MPDHSELFHQLSDKVKAVISPHVAVLAAKQCTSKYKTKQIYSSNH